MLSLPSKNTKKRKFYKVEVFLNTPTKYKKQNIKQNHPNKYIHIKAFLNAPTKINKTTQTQPHQNQPKTIETIKHKQKTTTTTPHTNITINKNKREKITNTPRINAIQKILNQNIKRMYKKQLTIIQNNSQFQPPNITKLKIINQNTYQTNTCHKNPKMGSAYRPRPNPTY